MADTVAFTACLTRIGFNPPTRTFIRDQGFASMSDLRALPLDDVDSMFKAFVKAPHIERAGEEPISFPYLAQRKFKALRLWCDYRVARGQDTPAVAFTDAVSTLFLKRLAEIKAFKQAADDDEVKEPGELKSMGDWPTYEEEMLSYFGSHRSTFNYTPLVYLSREEEEVSEESREAEYATLDDDLIRNTTLEGENFQLDNRRAFDLFKPRIMNSPGWTFVKQFRKTKDFRAAWLALKTQAEGAAAKTTRKAKAYAQIATARYTGKARFTFDQYVARHQSAHNELEELEEPVAETKKVTDFIKGISDPRLETGKNIVDGDASKLGDFQACQQYFKTLVENSKTRTDVGTSRNVLTAKMNKGTGKKPRSKGSTGYLSPKEYNKLSQEEKLALKRRREEAKAKKRDETDRRMVEVVKQAFREREQPEDDPSKTDDQPTRQVKKVRTETTPEKSKASSPSVGISSDAKALSAAAQFGRSAHSWGGKHKDHAPTWGASKTTTSWGKSWGSAGKKA